MKIYDNKPPHKKDLSNVLNTSKNKGVDKAQSSDKINRKDFVNLSKDAQEISKLKSLIEQLPEIRADKVEAIKKAIESGTYTIDPLKIAEKILEEL